MELRELRMVVVVVEMFLHKLLVPVFVFMHSHDVCDHHDKHTAQLALHQVLERDARWVGRLDHIEDLPHQVLYALEQEG